MHFLASNDETGFGRMATTTYFSDMSMGKGNVMEMNFASFSKPIGEGQREVNFDFLIQWVLRRNSRKHQESQPTSGFTSLVVKSLTQSMKQFSEFIVGAKKFFEL